LCLVLGATTAFLGYKTHLITEELDRNNQWVDSLENDLQSTYQQMKALDNAEMFSKDDEVGVIFSEIVALITKIKHDYIHEETPDEKK
jgi:hypothetical protein